MHWNTFFSSMTAFIDQGLMQAKTDGIARASAFVDQWILLAIALAFGVFAIPMMTGLVGMQDGLRRFVKLLITTIIVVTLLNVSVYTYYIDDFANVAIPDAINQISGTTNASTTHNFDVVWNLALDAMWSIWDSAPYMSWRIILYALMLAVYAIVAGAAVFCGYGIWLIGHVMAQIYLIIFFVVIPLAMYETTRPIMRAWLGAFLSTLAMQCLSILVALIMVKSETFIFRAILNDQTSPTPLRLGMLLGAAGLFGVFYVIARRIPSEAAQLCGGVGFMPYAIGAATYGAAIVGARIGARSAVSGIRSLNIRPLASRSSFANPQPGPSISSGS